ncbi:hypothetical protein P4S72_29670 [Vibrio sp. PP-XX7]
MTGMAFIHCISHHNIDDGWDLFNKVEDGPDGAVTILDSAPYMNGQTMTVHARGGTRGNGFKLGGRFAGAPCCQRKPSIP